MRLERQRIKAAQVEFSEGGDEEIADVGTDADATADSAASGALGCPQELNQLVPKVGEPCYAYSPGCGNCLNTAGGSSSIGTGTSTCTTGICSSDADC